MNLTNSPMNKRLHLLILPLLGLSAFTSCVGDEPANAECDIEQCWVHFDNPSEIFFHDYDTMCVVPSAQTDIRFLTRYDAVVSTVDVTFRVTPNAKITMLGTGQSETTLTPAGENTYTIPVDLASGQIRHFRVVSEDGKWDRTYSLSMTPKPQSDGNMFFDFETYALHSSNAYYEWVQGDMGPGQWWSTGNPGFRLSVSSAKPDEYPTVPEEGIDRGACVKLTTRDTGGFGKMVNMRIAAGNLFVGTFDVANALKDALKATQMGLPFAHKPQRLTGFYKFRPGATFQDKEGNPVAGRQDVFDIYIVVYKNIDSQGNKVQLYGDDILTSPQIVGLARIDSETIDNSGTEWVRFELPVEYTAEISREDIESEMYNTAVVFSSSIRGAYFEGAVGSTLWIDNVTLECEY